MKHHVVNRDKIIHAFVEEPHVIPEDGPITSAIWTRPHGWQVVLVVGHDARGRVDIVLPKDNEEECIKLIDRLNYTKIKSNEDI